ncbi:unnamed protein product, partial [Ectocarpus fasciculatus]
PPPAYIFSINKATSHPPVLGSFQGGDVESRSKVATLGEGEEGARNRVTVWHRDLKRGGGRDYCCYVRRCCRVNRIPRERESKRARAPTALRYYFVWDAEGAGFSRRHLKGRGAVGHTLVSTSI